jgi:RNA polymerase sigma factor (sigma-70 family)
MELPRDHLASVEQAAADQDHLRAVLDQRALLLGYINAIVRDLHAAEDILQESLVLATRQRFNDVPHAQGWIRVTARNLALAELRRRTRRPATLSDEAFALLEPAWEEATGDGHPHGARLEALRACCAGLSASARQLLELRFHEGLEGAAISARISRPLNTVYVGLSRTYRRLAECIAQRLAGVA